MSQPNPNEEKPVLKVSSDPNEAVAATAVDSAVGALNAPMFGVGLGVGGEVPSMELQAIVANEMILKQLARQVEYYFSTTNLSKDTYVSTLRSLNDGYVPVTIIANFGKVQSLVPYDAFRAVCFASQEHSELLEIVHIDSNSGKRVVPDADNGDDQTTLVQAVGPIGGEPIPASKLSSNAVAATATTIATTATATTTSPPSPSAAVQNTVVLREVPEGIQEPDIRELFSFDKCPSIREFHKDVANCWFVTLDTDSRDVMLDVMFSLRTKRYSSGETVKARVKSGIAMNRDAATSSLAFFNPAVPVPPINTHPSTTSNNSRKNKKKKNAKSRGNNSNTNNNNNSNGSISKGKNANSGRRRAGNKQKATGETEESATPKSSNNNNKLSNGNKVPSSQPAPPNLGGEQFPPLPGESSSNKVEVEKVPTHYELGRKGSATSDASSTATISTSSSKSPAMENANGGYAAALRKAAAVPPPKKPSQENTTTTATSKTTATTAPKTEKKKSNHNKKKNKGPATPVRKNNNKTTAKAPRPVATKVEVKPPTWGHGSFAEILRT